MQPLRLAALLGLLLAAPAAAQEPAVVQFDADGPGAGWQAWKSKERVTLQRRKVAGSAFYEHRAVIELPVDPARAAAEIWATLREGDMDSLKHREVLRAGPDEVVMYDQIRTPVVSDRDYTIVVRRVHDPATGRTQFRCRTANELGPGPVSGFVRIPVVRAGWMVEPDGRGGSRVTYYAYSEPGGLVAAFLVRGAQADRSLADVLRMRRRLLTRSSTTAASPR